MASASDIFDRTDVLKLIESQCLSSGGTSGVLLCPQKVGKSYLLDHIYAQRDRPDLIFCRINPDTLREEQVQGDPYLDQAFLKHFIRRLHRELESWVEVRTEQEPDWIKRLDEIEHKLVGLAGSDDPEAAERRKLLDENKKAFSSPFTELKTLRLVSAGLAKLLEQREVQTIQVTSLLERLQRLQKRVVLLIDDYHRIVGEGAFSEVVFRFLRAANSDETIIALASSPKNLMDLSLHRGDHERSTFFNHFNQHVLRPFKNSEADQFLDWLARAEAPLSPDQKAYLRELGGGSPYFLRQAREQFVAVGMPAANPAREEFERQVFRGLEGAFRDIWHRCSAGRRTVLRDVVQGKAAKNRTSEFQELVDDGYLVETGADVRIFSRLFAQFVTQQLETDAYEGVSASALVSHTVFPTALAFAKPDEPLVTFHLNNPTATKVHLKLSCELTGYSDEARQLVKLEPSERRSVGLTVVLRDAPVRALTSLRHASVRFAAELIEKGEHQPLEDRTQQLSVLPKDNLTFARRDQNRNVLVDFTWLIAAWVNKDEPELEQIRQEARKRRTLSGYPDPEDPEAVLEQVEALYEALKIHRLDYDNSAMVFHHEHADFVQRVRLPGQVLRNKSGNCLEGCVVFASLLSAADIHPLILFLPGHAVVGWKVRAEDPAEWSFLDTTVISSVSFADSCKEGQSKYLECKSLCEEWQARVVKEIRSTQRFAIPVDIHQVWKTRRLASLPE